MNFLFLSARHRRPLGFLIILVVGLLIGGLRKKIKHDGGSLGRSALAIGDAYIWARFLGFLFIFLLIIIILNLLSRKSEQRKKH